MAFCVAVCFYGGGILPSCRWPLPISVIFRTPRRHLPIEFQFHRLSLLSCRNFAGLSNTLHSHPHPLLPPYRSAECCAWLEADELVNSNMEIYLMMSGVCTTPPSSCRLHVECMTARPTTACLTRRRVSLALIGR